MEKGSGPLRPVLPQLQIFGPHWPAPPAQVVTLWPHGSGRTTGGFGGIVFKGNTFEYRGRIVATSIKLDDEMKQRIQKLAGLRRRSAHWILREAIAQYVEREEARESFKQEARESWTEFQET